MTDPIVHLLSIEKLLTRAQELMMPARMTKDEREEMRRIMLRIAREAIAVGDLTTPPQMKDS